MSISLRSRIWNKLFLAALLLGLLSAWPAPSPARVDAAPRDRHGDLRTPLAVETSVKGWLFAAPYCPDYVDEPDDNPLSYAGYADPNDAPYLRAFCTGFDIDWYRFEANAGDTFVIETFLPNPEQVGTIADPNLTLYRQEPHGFTQLAFDDNGGQNLGARIVYTPPAGGELFVAVRNALNQGDPTYRYLIDFTLASVNGAPTASAPTHQLTAGSTLGNPSADLYTIDVRAAWAAGDPDDGIKFQTLQGQVDGGGFVTLAPSLPGAVRSHFIPVTIGATNQLQVSATDTFGASSGYATGKSFEVLGLQDTDCAYEGTWTKHDARDAWGGTYMSTDGSASPSLAAAGDAAATCSFTGTSLALLGMTRPDGGRAEIFVDGVLRGVADFYSVKPMNRQLVFAVNDLDVGAHEMEVRWTNVNNEYSSGFRISLDGAIALD